MRLLPCIAIWALLSSGPALAFQDDSQEYYRSTDGSEVHRPTHAPDRNYRHETAFCRDGTHSYSHHYRGTCSHHSGVKQWED
jgi:hypothetical protein